MYAKASVTLMKPKRTVQLPPLKSTLSTHSVLLLCALSQKLCVQITFITLQLPDPALPLRIFGD